MGVEINGLVQNRLLWSCLNFTTQRAWSFASRVKPIVYRSQSRMYPTHSLGPPFICITDRKQCLAWFSGKRKQDCITTHVLVCRRRQAFCKLRRSSLRGLRKDQIMKKALLLSIVLFVTCQFSPAQDKPRWELFAGYQYPRLDTHDVQKSLDLVTSSAGLPSLGLGNHLNL